MSCELHWVGVVQWWCQMGPSGQAAWVQAIGSILAIGAAIFIPYWQRNRERKERAAHDRKVVMSAAANLEIALQYESEGLSFSPKGDGVIRHDFNLEQAREFMKLRPQTHEALQSAIDKSHYFSEQLCESIVRLGIEAAAYERVIDEAARRAPNGDADVFFKSVTSTKLALSRRLEEVRKLLSVYLPEISSKP